MAISRRKKQPEISSAKQETAQECRRDACATKKPETAQECRRDACATVRRDAAQRCRRDACGTVRPDTVTDFGPRPLSFMCNNCGTKKVAVPAFDGAPLISTNNGNANTGLSPASPTVSVAQASRLQSTVAGPVTAGPAVCVAQVSRLQSTVAGPVTAGPAVCVAQASRLHFGCFSAAILLFLILCARARADYLAPGAGDCAGISNLVLIYSGDNAAQNWNTYDFESYVYHLDSEGRADGWFFDGFLFLAQALPGGQAAEASQTAQPSDMKSWQWFVDRIFQKGKFLPGLDAAVGRAGTPAAPYNIVSVRDIPPRKAVIMIPYPSPRQHNFGDVDGDGKSEDFANTADRLRAVKWHIGNVLARWDAAGFQNVKLAGFYWMEESWHPEDRELLPAVRDYLHEKGMKLFWIPYYFGGPDNPNWRNLGFDCPAKQPNYFFPRWQAEKSRVNSTARLARRLGIGMELEVDDSVISNPAVQYPKYLRYLDAGVEEGYMTGAFKAYYQGVRTLDNLYVSSDPRMQSLYDMTYDFVKGTYKPEAEKKEGKK